MKKKTLTIFVALFILLGTQLCSPLSADQNISLQPGFNFISLSVQPSTTVMSGDLLTQYGFIDQIFRFDVAQQTFQFHLRISGSELFGNSFELQPGQGYILKCSIGSPLAIAGSDDTNVTANLMKGFNFVGFPAVKTAPTTQGLFTSYTDLSSIFRWDSVTGGFGFVLKLSDTEYFGNGFTLAEGQAYFLNSGSDFNLTWGEAIGSGVVDLAPEDQVAGTGQLEGQIGLDPVAASAYPGRQAEIPTLSGIRVWLKNFPEINTITDEAGRFKLEKVPVTAAGESHIVEYEKPGEETMFRGVLPEVEVQENKKVNLNIVKEKPIVIRQAGSAEGLVALSDGLSPLGVNVYIPGISGMVAKADEDGSFALLYVPEGEFPLVYQAYGYETYKTTVIVKNGEITQTNLVTLNRETVAEVRGEINGYVTDNGGEPLIGAMVSLASADGSSELARSTSSTGYYQFKGLASGNYKLHWARNGFKGTMETVLLSGNEVRQKNKKVESATPVVLPGLLYGTVTVEGDGRPVRGAVVTTAPPSRQVFTDNNGFFSLELPAGKFMVLVKKAGFDNGHLSITVPSAAVVSGQIEVKAQTPLTTVASVAMNVSAVTVNEGQIFQFVATLKDGDNLPLYGKAVTWSVSDQNLAAIDQRGMLTARASGIVTVTATADGKSAQAEVTIPTSTVTLSSLSLLPATLNVEKGQIRLLNLVGQYSNGELRVILPDMATWTTTPATGILDMPQPGVFQGVGAGNATIQADFGGLSAAVDAVVQAPVVDLLPPLISHRIPPLVPVQALPISATVVDNVTVTTVQLAYRIKGALTWERVTMTAQGNDYSATIPADFLTSAGLEYYLEASDGTNFSKWPLNGESKPVFLVQETLAALELGTQEITLPYGARYKVSDLLGMSIYTTGRRKPVPLTWSQTAGDGIFINGLFIAPSTDTEATFQGSFTDGVTRTVNLLIRVRVTLIRMAFDPPEIHLVPGAILDLTTVKLFGDYSDGSRRLVTQNISWQIQSGGGTLDGINFIAPTTTTGDSILEVTHVTPLGSYKQTMKVTVDSSGHFSTFWEQLVEARQLYDQLSALSEGSTAWIAFLADVRSQHPLGSPLRDMFEEFLKYQAVDATVRQDLEKRFIRDLNAIALTTNRSIRSSQPLVTDWSAPALQAQNFVPPYWGFADRAKSYITGYVPQDLAITQDAENLYIRLRTTQPFFGLVADDWQQVVLNVNSGSVSTTWRINWNRLGGVWSEGQDGAVTVAVAVPAGTGNTYYSRSLVLNEYKDPGFISGASVWFDETNGQEMQVKIPYAALGYPVEELDAIRNGLGGGFIQQVSLMGNGNAHNYFVNQFVLVKTEYGVSFSGNIQVNNARLNAAPSRLQAPNRQVVGRAIHAELLQNDSIIQTVATSYGTFRFNRIVPDGERYAINIRDVSTGKIFMRKYLGVVYPLSVDVTSNLVINETTTAHALLVGGDTTGVIQGQSYNLISGSDGVSTMLSIVFPTEISELQSQVKLILATLQSATTDSQFASILYSDMSFTNLKQMVSNAVNVITNDAAVKTMISSSVASFTMNGVGFNVSTVTVAAVTAATQTVISSTTADSVPVVTSLSVDGQPLYSSASGSSSGVVVSGSRPTFTVNFSRAVTATPNASMSVSVVESDGSSSQYQTVYTGISGYGISWNDLFDNTPMSISNATSYTFTVRSDSAYVLKPGMTYQMSVSSWSGFSSNGFPLILPNATLQFTTADFTAGVLETLSVANLQSDVHPSETQQLKIIGHYSDGSNRDVTKLCLYQATSGIFDSQTPGLYQSPGLAGIDDITVTFEDKTLPLTVTIIDPQITEIFLSVQSQVGSASKTEVASTVKQGFTPQVYLYGIYDDAVTRNAGFGDATFTFTPTGAATIDDATGIMTLAPTTTGSFTVVVNKGIFTSPTFTFTVDVLQSLQLTAAKDGLAFISGGMITGNETLTLTVEGIYTTAGSAVTIPGATFTATNGTVISGVFSPTAPGAATVKATVMSLDSQVLNITVSPNPMPVMVSATYATAPVAEITKAQYDAFKADEVNNKISVTLTWTTAYAITGGIYEIGSAGGFDTLYNDRVGIVEAGATKNHSITVSISKYKLYSENELGNPDLGYYLKPIVIAKVHYQLQADGTPDQSGELYSSVSKTIN